MEIETLYVAEYSKSQGCFHVETLAECLSANRRIVAARAAVDYVPFALCASMSLANAACGAMERLQRQCGGSHQQDQAEACQRESTEIEIERAREESDRLDLAYGVAR